MLFFNQINSTRFVGTLFWRGAWMIFRKLFNCKELYFSSLDRECCLRTWCIRNSYKHASISIVSLLSTYLMFCLSLFSQFDDPNEPVVGSCFTLMSRLLCRMMSIEKRFFIMAPTREDELNVSFLESWLSNLGCQTWGVVLSHDNYSKSVFESYNALHHLIFCCAVCLLYY